MKNTILPFIALLSLNAYSQTVPTTTITGSLKINDSLNVSNNITATDIHALGEMTVTNDLKAEKDVRIDGNTKIVGDIVVEGVTNLSGGAYTSELMLGNAVDNITIATQPTTAGGQMLKFGFPDHRGPVGPYQSPPTTCIAPYTGVMSLFNERAGVAHGTSPNMLDFNNDGANGFIDYGYNIGIEQLLSGILPALKINSKCNGDVQLAKGGGVTSTGDYFEVGNVVRNSSIASNVFASNRVGQRVTANSTIPLGMPNATGVSNTQLFVNRNISKALTVFNTQTNTTGDEVFIIYGDGKTQISGSTQTANYFTVKDVSIPAAPVDGFAVTGSGYIRMNTPNTAQVKAVIDVRDITNNKDLFRVNSDGHVFAREVEIKALNLAFPDYVFAKDYKRLSLPELDAFIKVNKHLPGFEKAEYYETNGIKTTDMFVKQQETIENLTLYIIELEKRLKALEEKNKQ